MTTQAVNPAAASKPLPSKPQNRQNPDNTPFPLRFSRIPPISRFSCTHFDSAQAGSDFGFRISSFFPLDLRTPNYFGTD